MTTTPVSRPAPEGGRPEARRSPVHAIENRLASALAHVELVALDDGLSAQQREDLAITAGAIERAGELLEQLTTSAVDEQITETASELQRTVDLLTSQTHILELIAGGAPLQEALDALITTLERHIPGSRCSILLLDTERGQLWHGSAPSLPDAYCDAINGMRIGPGQGSCGTAAFTRESVIAVDVATDERWEEFRHLALQHGLQACWSSPIIAAKGDTVLGSFAVYHPVPHRPSPDEERLVERFSHLAAVAIDHHRLLGALRESEERFRGAFEEAAVGMALVGLDGRFLQVNRALCALLGRPGDELVTMRLHEVLHPDDLRAEGDAMRDLLASMEAGHHAERRVIRSDGERRWVATSSALVPGPDQAPLYFCIHVKDVSEERRAQRDRRAREAAEAAREAAEEASRAKSGFLSTMSHELRTPLNSVLGFAELLELDDGLSQAHRQDVRHMLDAATHLRDLVDEALDVARIEAGALALSLHPVTLPAAVHGVVALLHPLAQRAGITLSTRHDDADATVIADPQRLRQILLNLVDNGVKYNRPGGTVTVCTAIVADTAQIRVTDTGPGLTSEELERLFRPFERLGAHRRRTKGTGLGLTLSRGLAEAMGGRLTVTSQPGIGTTFTLELTSAGPFAEARSQARREAAPAPRSTPAIVVCIEDNPENVRLIQRVLQRRPGVTMEWAACGAEALAMLDSLDPDLVLLDLDLPDLPGNEVLRRLSNRTAGHQPPVIVISATADTEAVERLRHDGADEYLTKPLQVRAFLDAVDRFLAASG